MNALAQQSCTRYRTPKSMLYKLKHIQNSFNDIRTLYIYIWNLQWILFLKIHTHMLEFYLFFGVEKFIISLQHSRCNRDVGSKLSLFQQLLIAVLSCFDSSLSAHRCRRRRWHRCHCLCRARPGHKNNTTAFRN